MCLVALKFLASLVCTAESIWTTARSFPHYTKLCSFLVRQGQATAHRGHASFIDAIRSMLYKIRD